MTDLKRRIDGLQIGQGLIEADFSVARLSENRYIVVKDETVYDFGGNRARVGYVMAQVLECVTGQPQIYPCADCGCPTETHRTYCNRCWSARVQESKHAS